MKMESEGCVPEQITDPSLTPGPTRLRMSEESGRAHKVPPSRPRSSPLGVAVGEPTCLGGMEKEVLN